MTGSNRFVRRKVEDEEFRLDLEAGRFYGLNETASEIVDLWTKGVRAPADINPQMERNMSLPLALPLRNPDSAAV